MGSQSRTWQHTRMHPNGIISIKIQPYLTCFVKLFFFFLRFHKPLDKYSQGVSISDTTEEINISLKGFVVYGISFTKGI